MKQLDLVNYEPTTRPFQCDWDSCNKSFNRQFDLQRHYRIHINERPYICTTPGCGKSFIQRSALNVHIRTHTGEKPHQCQHIGCGKSFSDSSSLARHRRIHIGMLPYKRSHDACLKSFCRKTEMVKHQRWSQRGTLHSNDVLDSCTSELDIGQPPPSSGKSMSWSMQGGITHPTSTQGHRMLRDASFAIFDHHVSQHGLPEQVGSRHNLPTKVHEYHDEDANIQMAHGLIDIPQLAFDMFDQTNLEEIVTMNTTVPRAYRLVRKQVEQPVIEMPCSTGRMNPISSGPAGFSPVSSYSPAINDCMSMNQPPTTSTYGLQDATPVDSQNNSVIYTQDMLQTQGSQSENEWDYNYQPHVYVRTIEQICAFGSAISDM